VKVLHLIPSLGSGGAERQLSIVAPALAKAGIEIHVGYCYDGPNIQNLIDSSVHLHKFSITGNHDVKLFYQLWSLVHHVKPDIIHTWILQMDIVGGVVARLAGVPFIVSERSSQMNYPDGWKTRLRVLIGKMAMCVIANSRGGVEYWQNRSKNLNIRMVRNCITGRDGNEQGTLARVSESGSPFILFAGRLSHEKNIFVMIEAMIEALKKVPGAEAHIFGEGGLKTSLLDRVSESGLSKRIHVHGYTADLANWMAEADVLVSTSWFEGNPNAVLEAAASGCPLVISDIPAHREIFDNESATFAEPDSPDEFTRAIQFLLRNKSVAKMKAVHAKKLMQGYGMSNVIESYLDIYEKILARN
jgi:glycosyltransferase involved in cell wall biosynthesis